MPRQSLATLYVLVQGWGQDRAEQEADRLFMAEVDEELEYFAGRVCLL